MKKNAYTASGETTSSLQVEHMENSTKHKHPENQVKCETLLGFQVLSKQENHLVSWLTNSAQKQMTL